MTDQKGGDGKIDLAELRKLDQKLGGVKADQKALRKLLDTPPKPQEPATPKP
jgi:hypothetical protein